MNLNLGHSRPQCSALTALQALGHLHFYFLTFRLFYDILRSIFCLLMVCFSIFCIQMPVIFYQSDISSSYILLFSIFVLSIYCLGYLVSRYFEFTIFPIPIPFPIRYRAYSIFCDSIFCVFGTLSHQHFALSIFCLSISRVLYFATRFFVTEATLRQSKNSAVRIALSSEFRQIRYSARVRIDAINNLR